LGHHLTINLNLTIFSRKTKLTVGSQLLHEHIVKLRSNGKIKLTFADIKTVNHGYCIGLSQKSVGFAKVICVALKIAHNQKWTGKKKQKENKI